MAVDAEAALARHLDQLRGGARRGSEGHMAGAKGHTPYRSIDAGALVLAAGAEVLAVLVNPAVVFAGATFGLGPADAVGSAHVVAVVALQAFVVVAGPSLVAVLVELGGAHLAAAAAVGDRTYPWGAGWGPDWTLTHHRAPGGHQAHGGHLQGSKQQQRPHAGS